MCVDYISDLHLDFILDALDEQDEERRMAWVFETYMQNREQTSEILVIAGDMGHCNDENIGFLGYLRRYYKHIVLVFGNHDLYLVSGNQKDRYADSFGRLADFRSRVEAMDNVHFLSGDCVEIGGIRIAGAGLWYDYSHGLDGGQREEEITAAWFKGFNDANLITTNAEFASELPNRKHGGFTLDNIAFANQQKMQLLETVRIFRPDVIVSHVPPIPEIAMMSDKTGRGTDAVKMNYYCTDTTEFIPYIDGKVWICGHTHNRADIVKNGCRYLANPFGYFEEDFGVEVRRPIRSVIIEKENTE